MGLFRAIQGVAEIQQQTGLVKNARKQILDIRDRLRNTPQFSKVFYDVVKDCKHPPTTIIGDYSKGAFWSIGWDPQMNNYEPYSTLKLQDANIGYYESCAIFLLIQECYPNVYDFPNRTTTEIAQNVPVELLMKKGFIGKTVIPAMQPQPIASAPVAPALAGQGRPQFCCHCGGPLNTDARFCPSCGNKIG